ncbi:hypothetical protein Lal_00001380 [Lupinus albus]|nr:hypothetical protein Lal_00001380 [Lupinus albus]
MEIFCVLFIFVDREREKKALILNKNGNRSFVMQAIILIDQNIKLIYIIACMRRKRHRAPNLQYSTKLGTGYKDEPFILASQAQQVFYVSDPSNKKWSIVLLTNKIIINNIDDQEDIDADDYPFFRISLSHKITTNDDLYTRDDHDDGLWVNEILTREDNNITIQKPSKKRKH